MIRVYLIEDHPVVIDGVRQRFRHKPDLFCLAGSSPGIAKFLACRELPDADLLLLDLWLPGSGPVENLRAIRNRYPHIPVVIFTQETSPYWIRTMMENGAGGYLLKSTGSREFLAGLEQVYLGKTISPALPAVSQAGAGEARPDTSPMLRPSEREILRKLVLGASLKEIAGDLCVTVSAVEKKLRRLRDIFGVRTNPELVHLLTEQRIL